MDQEQDFLITDTNLASSEHENWFLHSRAHKVVKAVKEDFEMLVLVVLIFPEGANDSTDGTMTDHTGSFLIENGNILK